ALKTGQAMWASAHAAAVQANAPRVAVIPTADAPAPKPAEKLLATAHAAALRSAKGAIPDASAATRRTNATPRQPSKAAGFKAKRAKLRSKAPRKRRLKR
ncbi:MAG TPA: hypothetical protein VGF58_13675, partial [Burkholderiales bacterium]